jgi:hypothetical protein
VSQSARPSSCQGVVGRCRALLLLPLLVSPQDVVPDSFKSPVVSRRSEHTSGRFCGFIENRGQWDTATRFMATAGDLAVRAEPGSIVVQLSVREEGLTQLGVVRLVFDGTAEAEPRGDDRVPGEFHFLKGADASRWRSHVPAFGSVLYPDIRAGTDVKLYRRDGRFEYDVLLSPLASVADVVVRCEGIDGMSLESNGDLRMATGMGALVQHAPTAWQVRPNGEQIPATCTFRIFDQQRFGFMVPDREAGCSVVIDPGLTWSTYLGGSEQEWATDAEVLPDGNIVVLGRTESPNFPTTAGVFDSIVDSHDLSLTCIEPTGSDVVFSTVVGGSGWELPRALAVAADGRLAIGGWSSSSDYPMLAGSYDPTFNGGIYDACLTVLDPNGSTCLFSTLVGGSCADDIFGLGFTSTGLVVAAGQTCSPDFPTTPFALDASFGGGPADSFVTWFDPGASGAAQLVSSTYLGSTAGDYIFGLAIAPGNEPVVVGRTHSPDFPTTPGAFEEAPGETLMGFITRLSADGSALVASTHFAGGQPRSVTIDGETILICGRDQPGFPASATAYDPSPNGFGDGFIARFDGQLSEVLAATLVGGSHNDSLLALAVDAVGNIIIAGQTESEDYPTTPGAFDTEKGAAAPASTSMVSSLSGDLSQLLYSSFLGPALATASWANDVAAIGVADVVIVGQGAGSTFPVTPGSFDDTYNGGGDGYVVRMLLKSTWTSLGGALAGSNGIPALSGDGELVGGQPVTLTLLRAKPDALATLVLGLGLLDIPFKGGALIPTPDILVPGMPVSATGSLIITAPWPSGLPAGFTTWFQYWIQDSVGPAGHAASNGLSAMTP